LDHLCHIYQPSTSRNGWPGSTTASLSGSFDSTMAYATNTSGAIVYVPGSTSSSTSTNDFNKLQNVLVNSDSVISEKAYHPAYTSFQSRLETYKEWPATLSQQPTDLARAGFYYFGIKDMVKCFFCNGGLKNWDHNDDPYQDHVRWFVFSFFFYFLLLFLC
jgi:hypothetical protein